LPISWQIEPSPIHLFAKGEKAGILTPDAGLLGGNLLSKGIRK
jgi:hypothetical protein